LIDSTGAGPQKSELTRLPTTAHLAPSQTFVTSFLNLFAHSQDLQTTTLLFASNSTPLTRPFLIRSLALLKHDQDNNGVH